MWTYNYNYELYHHGVKGMKWGVRRAQRKAARMERKAQRKAEIDKHYSVKDEIDYGRRGARRVAKYVSQGATRQQARKKVLSQQVAAGMAIGLATYTIGTALSSGHFSAAASKGKSKISSMMKDRDIRNQTVEVLGENGKVLKKFKQGWSEAAPMVNALVRR